MKKKLRISTIIILLLLLLIIYCLYNIVMWHINNKRNDKIQEEISSQIVVEDNPSESNDVIYKVNFKSLKEQNSDAIAYLKVPNTNIDYIIVKGKNNDYYLNHNFEKKWNSAGWIFADYKNKFDGTDKNIVVYGHNMKNGSMFGSLKNVLKKEWHENEENYEITLVTENKTNIYKVFSVYTIPAEEYYIKTQFKDNKEYLRFLREMKSRSRYDFGVNLEETDQILTLSTCKAGGKDRVVLQAKKI